MLPAADGHAHYVSRADAMRTLCSHEVGNRKPVSVGSRALVLAPTSAVDLKDLHAFVKDRTSRFAHAECIKPMLLRHTVEATIELGKRSGADGNRKPSCFQRIGERSARRIDG